MKLLDESIGKTFPDVNCCNVFLGQSLKAKEIKAKINKWDPVKYKLLHNKGNHKQNNILMQTTDQGLLLYLWAHLSLSLKPRADSEGCRGGCPDVSQTNSL